MIVNFIATIIVQPIVDHQCFKIVDHQCFKIVDLLSNERDNKPTNENLMQSCMWGIRLN